MALQFEFPGNGLCKLRDGRKAVVVALPEAVGGWVYAGVTEDGKPVRWDENGIQADSGNEGDWDLVEPWLVKEVVRWIHVDSKTGAITAYATRAEAAAVPDAEAIKQITIAYEPGEGKGADALEEAIK